MMGVLIAVSLVLGNLIFRETRITKEFLDAGRAYYAAESGIEIALYGLNNQLPGWQPDVDDDSYKSIAVDDEQVTVGEYRLDNRCNAYPCFPQDEFNRGTATPRQFYDILDLNKSITIPLFVVEEQDGAIVQKPVTDFTVEFFAPFNPQEDLDFPDFNPDLLAGWDVLRWKVFGIKDIGNGKSVTESISDFTAMSMLNIGGDENHIITTNATAPSWFGTVDCDTMPDSDRYAPDIQCGDYYTASGQPVLPTGEQAVDTESFGQVSEIQAGICTHTQAREYYLYNYTGSGTERKIDTENIRGCFPINLFISDPVTDPLHGHRLNYLTLTNLINPAVFKDPTNRQLARLFFRIELFTEDGAGQTVREYADITANGYSGDSKQSINVKIKRGSFMPVFHFSLYSTYMASGHGEDYWYGDDEEEPGLPK